MRPTFRRKERLLVDIHATTGRSRTWHGRSGATMSKPRANTWSCGAIWTAGFRSSAGGTGGCCSSMGLPGLVSTLAGNGARPWSRSTVSDAINRRIGLSASRWFASSSSLMMRGLDICADCWRRNPRSRTPKSGVLKGDFDESMTEILDRVAEQNGALAPAFVMIDPFGPKGSPMHLIGRVIENDESECPISFMYEPIRRFHSRPEYGPSLDRAVWNDGMAPLFGDPKRVRTQAVFARALRRLAQAARRAVCHSLGVVEGQSACVHAVLRDG